MTAPRSLWGAVSTQRVDTKTSRILEPGKLFTPGGGVILTADPTEIPRWERCETHRRRYVAGRGWCRVLQTHETRNIAGGWDRCTVVQRATLLGYWVHPVWIVTERIPGKRRANHKTAVVVLRTSPTEPHHFALRDSDLAAADVAAESSARTPGSSSTATRSRSASSAAGVAILPSAQAACPLTIGSSSDSAQVNAGTPPNDPVFPSTTAALRFRPRSFARFIGDPRNAAVYSAVDIVNSSSASARASLPATEARAKNGELSASDFANF